MYTPILFAAVLLAKAARGANESTNATCTEDSWTTNAEGLSPCLLGAILQGACFNDIFFLPALPQDNQYDGAMPGASNTCQCSSVTYSVVQACAACQGRSITPWQTWITNCEKSQVSIGSYPLTIANITVPSWAFLNVSTNGVFDLSTASTLTGLPESTLSSHSTSSTGSAGASGSGSSSSHSSDTGAIVGGVIGGVVALSLIGIGAFILYRRQHKRRRNQPRYTQEKVDMTQNYRYNDTYSLAPPRLYDPADPRTFPQSPAPTFSNSLLTTSTSPPPTSPGHRAANSSGSYSGIPEL